MNRNLAILFAAVSALPAAAQITVTIPEACIAAATPGGVACQTATVARPASQPPAPVPPPPAPPPAPSGPVRYISATGSGTACTEALPCAAPTATQMNAYAAGTTLLFKRGDVFAGRPTIRLFNRNVTASNPLTLDAYGEGPAPEFRMAGTSGYAFEFGAYTNAVQHAGYVFRNLKLVGPGPGASGNPTFAFWFRGAISDVTIDNVEMTNFYSPVNLQGGGGIHRATRINVLNSKLVRNFGMGINGTAWDSLFQGNEFSENNATGTSFVHQIYLSEGARNRVIGNTVRNRGVCTGGNITAHGMIDDLVIEGNTIDNEDSMASCYGISMTPGYTTSEGFRRLIVRNNTIINTGGASIILHAAPGAIVDGNTIIRTVGDRPGQWHIGILIQRTEQPNDIPGGGELVRNNTGCYSGAGAALAGGFINVGTTGGVTTSNATTGVCSR